jgi:hypothetical protein
MSFLPYVLSFLLLLAVGSSVVFSSCRSSAKIQAMVIAHQIGVVNLISEDTLARHKKKSTKGKELAVILQEKTASKKKTTEHSIRKAHTHTLQIVRDQLVLEGRLNLWPLVISDKKHEDPFLYEAAVRLVENLFKDCDFYKEMKDNHLARSIIDQIIEKAHHLNIGTKLTCSFDQLFPKDPNLALVFYKMLQGTSTTYHSLKEYCTISPKRNRPQFFCASTPVLQAILGDKITQKILLKEQTKPNQETPPPSKEEIIALIMKESEGKFNENNLSSLFLFNKREGVPCFHQNSTTKIRVKRKID